MAETWKVAAALEWREWDGEVVAYCDASGDTFKLAPVARVVIEFLATRGGDLNALANHVATTLNLANDRQLAADLEEIMVDLAGMGVIERTAS